MFHRIFLGAGFPNAVQAGPWIARSLAIPLFLPSLVPLEKRSCEYWSLLIGWDGAVSPCFAAVYSRPFYIAGERHFREAIHYGNVNEQDFREIWDAPTYQAFRRSMATDERNEVCKSCRVCEGVIVGAYLLPSASEMAQKLAAGEAGAPPTAARRGIGS